MSEIVRRLRDGEAHYSAVLVEGLNGYSLQLFRDAADEIERLRNVLGEDEKEIERIRAVAVDRERENERLRAENQRMRELLLEWGPYERARSFGW